MDDEIKGLRDLVASQKAKIHEIQNENGELKSALISIRIMLDKALDLLDQSIELNLKQQEPKA